MDLASSTSLSLELPTALCGPACVCEGGGRGQGAYGGVLAFQLSLSEIQSIKKIKNFHEKL